MSARAGVGLMFGIPRGGNPTDEMQVLGLVPNRPAALSGRIDVGDAFIAVDGWPVQNKEVRDVSEKIQGMENTLVTLSLKKAGTGELYHVSLLRKQSQDPEDYQPPDSERADRSAD
eukprot:CAMPEP_0113724702 /NCGR_PEP_ID=MMETSP0038_2-20120614/39259_1 /TAXON_ID=2898 /ORGANISM="Cryptomonas paramecium" /LENGTH=115 /DNA_ID=CAMNT_0000654699 /DNA_START=18 /DNA_END=362 /DNA_ORIENTATION=+ /assembly_acc=CAM_ASM_000170